MNYILKKVPLFMHFAIRKELSSRIMGIEVAVNLVSGSGKEHMALIAALIKPGIGFRLVTAKNNEMREMRE